RRPPPPPGQSPPAKQWPPRSPAPARAAVAGALRPAQTPPAGQTRPSPAAAAARRSAPAQRRRFDANAGRRRSAVVVPEKGAQGNRVDYSRADILHSGYAMVRVPPARQTHELPYLIQRFFQRPGD